MFEKETEEWYVILNMNCKYEICRRCPKSGLFKGSLKECDDWIKQKQKDEIKDKISMALKDKDPILQQAFEIICKENAELDCQMNRNKYCHSCVNATDRCFRKEIGCPCEKYKSYKDENAELKDKLEILISVGNICTKGLSEQLTKAKEIIKDYMIIVKGAHTTVCGVPEENRSIYALKLNEEAEQFISEVEKPIESSVDHIIEQNEKEVGLNPDYFLGGW